MAYNSIQLGTIIVFGITYFFVTLFIGLRYFQAIKLVKKIEIDLIILTLSYGLAMVYFVTMVKLMDHGWGEHIGDVAIPDLIEFNKDLLPNTLSYLITPSITKMAMLSILYRINPSRIYRYTVVAVAFAVFSYTLALASITGGPCSPLKEGTLKCLENVALAQSTLNIASDFAVVAVPIPTIHGLQFTTKQKISVGCILALGSGVVICSIARLPYVIILEHATDTTYTEAIVGIWSIVEVNLGIMCGCVMRLKPFIKEYFPRLGLFSSEAQADSSAYSSSWTKGRRATGLKEQGAYQLHSIQKGNTDAVSDRDNSHSFRTHQPSSNGNGDDGGSTDKILD